MAIIRNKSKNKYTVIDNNIFQNKKLSLKARGMLTTLLSLPDDWEFNENGLEQLFNDGLTSIKSSLKELESQGYLKRKQIRENGKFAKNEWIIYEKPLTENPITEKPILENDTQLNTNIQNTKKENISSSKDEEQKLSLLELHEHFEKIWATYPVKKGKQKAETYFYSWLKGRKINGRTLKLTDREMWHAVKMLLEEIKEEQKDLQYVSHGDTFFNNKIYDYYEKWKEKSNDNT